MTTSIAHLHTMRWIVSIPINQIMLEIRPRKRNVIMKQSVNQIRDKLPERLVIDSIFLHMAVVISLETSVGGDGNNKKAPTAAFQELKQRNATAGGEFC